MMPTTPAPCEDMTPDAAPKAAETGHKMSRKSILKDREDALRANLLKRKQQQQTRRNADADTTTD